MKIKSALEFSHELLSETVNTGDTVVDCTMGNGHDTLFLTDLVGKKGTVYGFDIQAEAVENTRTLLKSNHVQTKNVYLYNISHAKVDEILPYETMISGAIFNLGYLPGGDKTIVTYPETTIAAIKGCLNHLCHNGVVVVVAYYGHPGGEREKNTVLEFGSQLDQKQYSVLKYSFLNQKHFPPILMAIQRID
ncbi:class I SAM-dependent methyltransferase [Lentilactobacillus otakiensis]|uniref:tRNA (mnm(5)s(2)U34)-methyltransferase n=1 Tax=Lentilactobacillus otakiensis TaxID=481720 RepID=UPI003D166C6C